MGQHRQMASEVASLHGKSTWLRPLWSHNTTVL